MSSEIKHLVSVRLPAALVERIDFVTRNIDGPAPANRSEAILQAVEAWLPAREKRLRELGLTVPGE
jgi:metal-responsive CopG/Arc/MetJ family transcriptional regulator